MCIIFYTLLKKRIIFGYLLTRGPKPSKIFFNNYKSPLKDKEGKKIWLKVTESRCLVQSGTGSYMDTDPGVAFLIGREGRDCHVIDKGLVRG